MGWGHGPSYTKEAMVHWPEMGYSRNLHAQGLFDGIAAGYDTLAEICSFSQYGRWRRFLLSRLALQPEDTVLDLCTGTGGVAIALAQRMEGRVVGVDLSPKMLASARRRLQGTPLALRIPLVLGQAESLPFPDDTFDAVCFTFLLRYVDAPAATLVEIVRVLKPGGSLASLDFYVPQNTVLRGLWRFYTLRALPLLTWPISPGWRYVGGFLGPSIAGFYRVHSRAALVRLWEDVGMTDVRSQTLSLGGALVMSGTRRLHEPLNLTRAMSGGEQGGTP